MTSETSDSSAIDPSDSSKGPGPAPGAAEAAPTAPTAAPTAISAEVPAPVPAEVRAPLPKAGQDEQHTQAAPTVYHTSRVYGGPKQPPQERKSRRTVVIAAIAGVAALVLVAAVLMITVFKPGRSTGPPPAQGMIPAGTTARQDGEQVAAAFLAAWRAGDFTKAASLTSQPATAQAALAAYAKDLNLKKMTATPSGVTDAPGSTAKAPRENVRFAVGASVGAGSGKNAVRGKWTYHSSLVAYQQPNSQVWFVAWRPDVLAPNLTAATHLAAVTVPPTVSMVADASGQDLAKYQDPGLSTIAGLLKSTAPAQEGASAGLNVEIQAKSGKPLPNSQAIIVSPGNYPTLGTTIDPKAESLARKAVGMHKQSSIVVIQPSTGKILAIANNAGFNDFALTANVAPGSTMKIITSTALFNKGMTPQSPVACPAAYTVTGITYHNDQGENLPPGTPFQTDFAQSCNNAFTTQWPQLSGKLASTAKTYYGLNQPWNIGIGDLSASYFNAPASATGSELAQEAFGEGKLIASPLAMASVAATVDTGTFKQPYLRLGTRQLTATSLPAKTDAYLKQVMRAVVTSGTGAGLGLGPNVYAKTGTADIQGQDQPNSWLVAFDTSKDVAVACLVVNAGYGAQFAGPEAASFLNGY